MMMPTNQGQGCDTTIAALHKIRERLSDACNGDIRAISAAARKRQRESGRPTVSYAKSPGENTRTVSK
ncbi:MAG: hypothetical protein BWX80_03236 [Candidatus Hydrogenedentes bacterium ADurb.Bin101]|nr:MAG: hypothetical protein BWX80_03236 [Candidatus Hydrogenedentes bacterium ADurb.Bin101]